MLRRDHLPQDASPPLATRSHPRAAVLGGHDHRAVQRAARRADRHRLSRAAGHARRAIRSCRLRRRPRRAGTRRRAHTRSRAGTHRCHRVRGSRLPPRRGGVGVLRRKRQRGDSSGLLAWRPAGWIARRRDAGHRAVAAGIRPRARALRRGARATTALGRCGAGDVSGDDEPGRAGAAGRGGARRGVLRRITHRHRRGGAQGHR